MESVEGVKEGGPSAAALFLFVGGGGRRAKGVILAASGRPTPGLPKSYLAEVKQVTDNTRWTVICPCCEATITVDAQTGAIISHAEKAKPLASFEEMAKQMERQKQTREQVFAQELGSLKDRERLLEEKFREAVKRAEKDKDKPYRNPLDMD